MQKQKTIRRLRLQKIRLVPKVHNVSRLKFYQLCRTRNPAARAPAGHIVVVNEEVVLGAHAAEEFGHVVGKKEGCLAAQSSSQKSHTAGYPSSI